MMAAPMVSTYSMWSLFRNCRKAVEWRHLEQLVPITRDRNLHFGSIIHECLQTWHERRDLALVLDLIDRRSAARAQDEDQKRDWYLATAMMKGYAARYPAEEFEVVAIEHVFEGPIVNPATGASSRSFRLAGKVDGIVRIDREYFILEHKTVSQIDSDYLERLWTDFQITLYAHYVEQTMGLPVTGILYNVLVKARLQQSKGETEEEFEARRAELLAKSKTGRTAARRREPESDEDFQQRLAEKYADPAMFHRERLHLSRERFDILRAELWELSQAFLDARRRGVFYQNTSFCFNYQRPCPYFALCRSNGKIRVPEEAAPEVDAFEASRIIEQLSQADVDDVIQVGDGFRVSLRVLGGTVSHVLRMPSAKDVFEYRRGFARVLDLPYNRQELIINLAPAGALYKKLVESSEGYAGDVPIIHQAVAVKAAIDALDGAFEENSDPN
jgi:hypothetical protein